MFETYHVNAATPVKLVLLDEKYGGTETWWKTFFCRNPKVQSRF
jgi:hypothetical protein